MLVFNFRVYQATVAKYVGVSGADGADVGVGNPRPSPPSSSTSASIGRHGAHVAHVAHIIIGEAPLVHGGRRPNSGPMVVVSVVAMVIVEGCMLQGSAEV